MGGWIGIAAWDSHWSANVPWPTGTNLPRGAYVIGITAIDNAGNRSDISRNVTIGPADTTPPALAITAPVHGQIIDDLQGLNGISGTVNDGDGSGVASVQLYLARTWYEHSQLWNGTAWGGHHKFFLVPSAPDAEGVAHWNLADVPGGEQLGTGHYYIDVFATDRNGNSSYARHVFFVTPDDRIAPTVAVTFPSPDQELTQLPEIRGTSADVGSGVARVEVILVRQVPQEGGGTVQEYWNSTYWSTRATVACNLPSRLDTSWRRNQSLPSGADLAPGDYVVMCHAIDRYNNVTVAYRNFRIVPVPRLSIDAQIRADESSAWLGEGFSNSDAQGQTLSSAITSGARQTRQLRMVRRGGSASKTVKVTLPDWAQFAAEDWSARFYDAPDGGNDITGQITGASGWQTVMNDGDERLFRAEVTAPAGAEADISKALTFRVEADPTSETPALDVVKATWNVVVSTQPDVSLSALDENGLTENWTGVDEFSPTVQNIETVFGEAQTQSFALRIKNSGDHAASFTLANPPLPPGWSAKVYDALQGGGLLLGEIVTPPIEPNQSIVWRVEVTAVAPARLATLPLRASGGALFDEVTISAAMQSLVGLQWSRDGASWHDVTATTKLQSERYASIGFRALKSVPSVGWPNALFGPKWQWQGTSLEAETVWLSPHHITDGNGQVATATLDDNSFGATIVVLPDVDLYLEAALGVMPVGETVAISIRARDENDAPLAGARVRLRCTKGGADSGHFGEAPSGELFLLTDAQGKITTTWTAESVGRVQLSVEAVDGANAVFGEGDVWTMEVTGE